MWTRRSFRVSISAVRVFQDIQHKPVDLSQCSTIRCHIFCVLPFANHWNQYHMTSCVITWEWVTGWDLVKGDWGLAHQNVTIDPWSLLIVFGLSMGPMTISRAVEDFQGCLEVRRFQISKLNSWVWLWKRDIETSCWVQTASNLLSESL